MGLFDLFGKKKKAPKSGKPKKNKNISKNIPNGRTLQTRDEYFSGAATYRKPGYEKKGNYRKVAVVDSNRNDELAVVKLTTSKRGKSILGEKKSKYRPFVETKDEKGMPIKVGKKFIENPPHKDLSPRGVCQIKKDTFHDNRNALQNRKKVRTLKGRSEGQKK